MNRWPKIPLGLRLFFLYFILVGMTAYMVSKTVVQELKPTVRQTTEETLVDMANLLAVLAEEMSERICTKRGFGYFYCIKGE